MKYDSIIFDLDGTLWDASHVTASGWNNALIARGLGHCSVNSQDVKNVSGLPFSECVESLLGNIQNIDLAEIKELIDIEEAKIFEELGGQLYPGVETGITILAQKYPLFLVSNCQSWYLKKFWDQFDLEKYFTGHDCNGNANEPKSEMIKGIIKNYHLENPIYIGDTKGDKEACSAAGVHFGYASYGFGDLEKEEISLGSFDELTNTLGKI